MYNFIKKFKIAEITTWKKETIKDIGGEEAFNQEFDLRFIRILRLIRFFRFFKLSRYLNASKIIETLTPYADDIEKLIDDFNEKSNLNNKLINVKNNISIKHSILPEAPGFGGYDSVFTFSKSMQDEMQREYDAKWTEAQKKRRVKEDVTFKPPVGYSEHLDHFTNFFDDFFRNRFEIITIHISYRHTWNFLHFHYFFV